MPSIQTDARNATLSDLSELLKRQHDLKFDAVVPAANIHCYKGRLVVSGLSALDEKMVLTPTEICDGQIAEKLGIPTQYLRRLREDRIDLFDANVNGWLQGNADITPGERSRIGGSLSVGPDPRSFLLRSFVAPGEQQGIARAMLSDSFGIIDNLDVLLSVLDAIRKADIQVEIQSCQLTERRMYVRMTSPSITALAPALFKGYRSPFDGRSGEDLPIVHAGFDLSNSETGGGALELIPVAWAEVCRNGATRQQDKLRKVHLGGKMDQGIIRWSQESIRRNMELAASQARDAVLTFLDRDYLEMCLEQMTERAVVPLAEPQRVVELVAKQLAYTADEAAGILDHFIKGGQTTAGGVFQAVTSYAQLIENPDRAIDFEATALEALEIAATA